MTLVPSGEANGVPMRHDALTREVERFLYRQASAPDVYVKSALGKDGHFGAEVYLRC